MSYFAIKETAQLEGNSANEKDVILQTLWGPLDPDQFV